MSQLFRAVAIARGSFLTLNSWCCKEHYFLISYIMYLIVIILYG